MTDQVKHLTEGELATLVSYYLGDDPKVQDARALKSLVHHIAVCGSCRKEFLTKAEAAMLANLPLPTDYKM